MLVYTPQAAENKAVHYKGAILLFLGVLGFWKGSWSFLTFLNSQAFMRDLTFDPFKMRLNYVETLIHYGLET